ncbi:MAG TPA: hypothetical protein VHT24_10570 [Pseudacidobacterium sp.]|jgi:hypothetical protein|nr:hypothetical protein [Pseudacidobacterium sp.]
MMRRFKLMLMALSLLLLTQGQGQEGAQSNSSATGVVTGVVLTYEGKPASHYVVEIEGASPTSTNRKRALTSDEGAFTAEGLKYGDYAIASYLEGIDSRYSGGLSSFYDPNPVRIQLTESGPTKEITIHLGPPNRILSGTVTSSADGSPFDATIQIEYPNEPRRFIRFGPRPDGVYRVLIPAQTKLVMKTTAPGYIADSRLLGPIAEDSDPEVDIKLNPAAPN